MGQKWFFETVVCGEDSANHWDVQTVVPHSPSKVYKTLLNSGTILSSVRHFVVCKDAALEDALTLEVIAALEAQRRFARLSFFEVTLASLRQAKVLSNHATEVALINRDWIEDDLDELLRIVPNAVILRLFNCASVSFRVCRRDAPMSCCGMVLDNGSEPIQGEEDLRARKVQIRCSPADSSVEWVSRTLRCVSDIEELRMDTSKSCLCGTS